MAISIGAPLKLEEKIIIMIILILGGPISYFKLRFPHLLIRLIWI